MPLSPAPSRVNRQFTDRESFIEAFDEILAALDPARYDVLVYYGVGGIGKTALRKHLGKHLDAQQDPARWAAVNFEPAANRNPDNALFLARNALRRKYKFRFPSFDLAYTVYWERTHPQIPLARKALPFLEEGDLLNEVILAVEDVPGLGLVTKLPKAVAKLGGAAQRWWTKRGRADLQELASLDDREILDRLSKFWASDLKAQLALTGERVVLFLDTYEALWKGKRLEHLRFSVDEWVRQWILHLPGVLWVIAGREKLHWEEWNAEWAQYLHQHLVGKLADEDARRFLLTAGVHDEAVADAIIEGAEGVPFYLDVALDTFTQIAAQRTPSPDDFARAPRKVIDRFLKYLDRSERETINVLSAARAWDRALFEQLVTAFQTGYPPKALPELRRFSFIEDVDVEGEDAGPRWTMHALMRRGLQEHWAEENVAAVHQHLFDHYAATLENLDHRTLDETQRSALGEAFYHGRHVLEPEAFIAWFRQADDAFQQGAQWRLLIPLQEELAGVVEAAYGAEHEQTASALNNLAELYYRQANYEQAEPLYQRALTITEQTLGPDHPNVATTLNNLAELYRQQGKYDEVEPLHQRSLTITEQALGPDHPEVATTLNNLAELYRQQGKYEQVEPLHQRSLTIYEQALGPDHPDVAVTLNNLAGLYESQGKYEQAEPLYQRALAIMERALGLDHPNTRLVRANLARLRDRRSGEA